MEKPLFIQPQYEHVQLRHKNFTANCVSKYVAEFPNLRALDISYNKIDRFPHGLPNGIIGLDLSNNRLNDLKDVQLAKNIIELKVACNGIQSLQPLAILVKLEHLDVSYNSISLIEGLELMSQLQTLLISHNLISKLMSVRSMSLNRQISRLDMRGNPIATNKGYKGFLLGLLPSLRDFDKDDDISDTSRKDHEIDSNSLIPPDSPTKVKGYLAKHDNRQTILKSSSTTVKDSQSATNQTRTTINQKQGINTQSVDSPLDETFYDGSKHKPLMDGQAGYVNVWQQQSSNPLPWRRPPNPIPQWWKEKMLAEMNVGVGSPKSNGKVEDKGHVQHSHGSDHGNGSKHSHNSHETPNKGKTHNHSRNGSQGVIAHHSPGGTPLGSKSEPHTPLSTSRGDHHDRRDHHESHISGHHIHDNHHSNHHHSKRSNHEHSTHVTERPEPPIAHWFSPALAMKQLNKKEATVATTQATPLVMALQSTVQTHSAIQTPQIQRHGDIFDSTQKKPNSAKKESSATKTKSPSRKSSVAAFNSASTTSSATTAPRRVSPHRNGSPSRPTASMVIRPTDRMNKDKNPPQSASAKKTNNKQSNSPPQRRSSRPEVTYTTKATLLRSQHNHVKILENMTKESDFLDFPNAYEVSNARRMAIKSINQRKESQSSALTTNNTVFNSEPFGYADQPIDDSFALESPVSPYSMLRQVQAMLQKQPESLNAKDLPMFAWRDDHMTEEPRIGQETYYNQPVREIDSQDGDFDNMDDDNDNSIFYNGRGDYRDAHRDMKEHGNQNDPEYDNEHDHNQFDDNNFEVDLFDMISTSNDDAGYIQDPMAESERLTKAIAELMNKKKETLRIITQSKLTE